MKIGLKDWELSEGRCELMNDDGFEVGFGDLRVRVLEKRERLSVAIGK